MTLPVTIELCARIRDGYPCLGRIHRSGVPEIVHCEACGKREAGVVYTRSAPIGELLPPAADLEAAIAAIAESRASHVAWLDHPEDCADCRQATPTEIAGDHAHHAQCIAKYDAVLRVLRAVVALAVPPAHPGERT